ncbi:hypothetical protein J1G40_09215 [Muriicola sp. Z0-33]|nr:hypothetical protein [Muriicola sp. Z0-33]
MKRKLFLLLILSSACAIGQELSGSELLDKAIQYHDPNNKWPSFHGELSITMEAPDKSDRISDIVMNLPEEYFKLKASRDNTTTVQILNRGECTLSLNGSQDISEEEASKYRLSCDRAKTMRDYYTYLYGLPMKLKDPGTIIDPNVTSKIFKGKKYLVLKVTYKEAVGGDTWYFYFDPTSYAMEVYQFYHDESKNDGEYILLSGEENISGIKMPKIRAWYYNKGDTYLGTDKLTRTKAL